MKPGRTESLVSWMWTGAILIGVGLFFLIRGWFLVDMGMPPLQRRAASAFVDPRIALGGGVLLLLVGVGLMTGAVISKLRGQS